MDIILCHTTADFDTLGAAVGCTHLLPGSRIVLAGGCHPAVREYLALHRDEYPLIERRSVHPDRIRSLTIVDTQRRDRLGKTAEWLDRDGLDIFLYDHHVDLACDLGDVTQAQIEAVGATSTLIVEALQRQNLSLNSMSATVMALGIHVDTGSLTFDHTTPRDALALAWLMQQGANVSVLAQYVDPGLSPTLQTLLQTALTQLVRHEIQGFAIARVDLDTSTFVPGLSSLTSRLMDFAEADALLLVARYCRGEGCEPLSTDVSAGTSSQTPSQIPNPNSALTLIARSRIPNTDWNQIVQPWGGGGHPRAATVTLRGPDQGQALAAIWQAFLAQIPKPAIARELMSSPVRTIRPETTIQEAQRILLRYGHSGLSVVDRQNQLVGIISRRDLDLALHHGFGHAPVKGYMSNQLKTITPETPLPEIEALMVTFDVGRLPVLDQGNLVGIVTRTDVLRQLHQSWRLPPTDADSPFGTEYNQPLQLSPAWLQERLPAPLWQLLDNVAIAATAHHWQLYLVGGAVRDLLIAANASENLELTSGSQPEDSPKARPTFEDIDLVVDGCHPGAEQANRDDQVSDTTTPPSPSGAGVILAKQLQQQYPQARLQVHGRFQTAALLWHQDPTFGSLWVDIATSRTEFYPYPAANPEVEASSLQQDLYRRDFTINALALRLTPPHRGQLIDFFGGCRDLNAQLIRVLHPNSFIEDPTRIFRAVRFAIKLGFQIEPQTEGYIRYAIASGIYDRIQTDLAKAPSLQTRLKTELKYILQAPFWRPALKQLNQLGALTCLHPTLTLTPSLWKILCRCDRWWHSLSTTQPEAAWPPLWQLRLELLIATLAPAHRLQICEHLQLPDDCRTRFSRLASTVTALDATLPHCHRPSQVVQQLAAEPLPLLLIAAMQVSSVSRRQIYKYVMQWSQIDPPLDGHQLRQLGYQPGPLFKTMLQTLKFAFLDGEIFSFEDAQRYLAENFGIENFNQNQVDPLPHSVHRTTQRPGHEL